MKADPMIQIDERLIQKRSNLTALQIIAKRLIDILLSCILLIVLSPLLAIIAVLIRIDSAGPIIFKQCRIGFKGRPFTIYKFRTMVPDAEKQFELKIDEAHIEEFIFQSEDDPRVTRIGRFLRRTSLDELPQLFNVLKGDMSLVGPRPEIPAVVEKYTDDMRRRLEVKPGITGLAQVSGRGELPLGETIRLDIAYIDNYSFWQDIKILLKTVAAVFKREGAY